MKLFLDMDGVLVNFNKGIHDAFNKPYDYATLSSKWTFWNDWPNVTFDMVDDACTHEFWAELPWMHDGEEIFELAIGYFDFNDIYLLTSPMPNLGSPSGKWDWVARNLAGLKKQTIITNVDKGLFAGPDCVLIDDKNENIDAFRAAGGRAILVPRPWNRGNGVDTAPYIKRMLGDICGQL